MPCKPIGAPNGRGGSPSSARTKDSSLAVVNRARTKVTYSPTLQVVCTSGRWRARESLGLRQAWLGWAGTLRPIGLAHVLFLWGREAAGLGCPWWPGWAQGQSAGFLCPSVNPGGGAPCHRATISRGPSKLQLFSAIQHAPVALGHLSDVSGDRIGDDRTCSTRGKRCQRVSRPVMLPSHRGVIHEDLVGGYTVGKPILFFWRAWEEKLLWPLK